jgi:hypothetical protein
MFLEMVFSPCRILCGITGGRILFRQQASLRFAFAMFLIFSVPLLNRHPEVPLSEPALSSAGE